MAKPHSDGFVGSIGRVAIRLLNGDLAFLFFQATGLMGAVFCDELRWLRARLLGVGLPR